MDEGSAPALVDFWATFVRNESRLSVDTGADMSSARFFLRWARVFTASDAVLNEIVRNCVFGFLTVVLHALPLLDYERGRKEALAMLQAAQVVWSAVSGMEGFGALSEEAALLGWDVQSISGTLRSYAEVLGGAPSTGPGCGGLKFYVYPPPPQPPPPPVDGDTGAGAARPGRVGENSAAALLREGPAGYLRALAQSPLQCLFGMYGTELLYHRFVSSTGCRVAEPEHADLFFIPSYFKCIEVINYADHFNVDRAGEDEAALLFHQTLAHVRQAGPWFDRHDGADHVVLFSWGRFPCRLPGWREAIRSAIALQVEDRCEDLNSEEPQSTFSRWKDIIIPGHIDRWRALELRRQNQASSKRDVLIAFHGRHGNNTDSYSNVSVRTRILEMEGLPGVSVGGFIEDYHELLGMSIFCLAPRGITPWTIHLYVAIMAGCIPIILSDHFELPFQDRLNWQSFSIRWPENRTGRELYQHLLSIPVDVIHAMKREVDEHACWFDYYSSKSGCSPYVATLATLERRLQQRPRYAGRWWSPEPVPS
uniref:Exostosin GT47 domain-containing protein n=1 Tax=Alexandrium monilatum TaxID=311494 RepID=A0A7S4PY79_9DINO